MGVTSFWPAQTVSQNSRTGLRLVLTDVRRPGTELVRPATDSTAPVVAARFAWMARKWKITRTRPTAVMLVMSAEAVSVVRAAARIDGYLLRLAQQRGDGVRVPGRPGGDIPDRLVSGGECLGHALEVADEFCAARQDSVTRVPDPLQRCQHAVEKEDHQRQHQQHEYRVTEPPPAHDRYPLLAPERLSCVACGVPGNRCSAPGPAQTVRAVYPAAAAGVSARSRLARSLSSVMTCSALAASTSPSALRKTSSAFRALCLATCSRCAAVSLTSVRRRSAGSAVISARPFTLSLLTDSET